MAIAKELTSNAWILETESGEKLGILSCNAETGIYQLISEDTNIQFDTMEQLEIAIDQRIKVQQREVASATFKEIDGYPVAHECPLDVEHLEDGRIAYRSSKRRQKRFFAGYWATPDSSPEQWYAKVSISEEVFDRFTADGYAPVGPFKDKVEALFAAKQAASVVKNSNK